MSDIDDQADLQDVDLDDYSHQACYIFKPFETKKLSDRPNKKRKTQHEYTVSQSLPLLCHGKESRFAADRRLALFEDSWAKNKSRIDKLIAEVDTNILQDIVAFSKSDFSGRETSLPTALVVSGPDSSVQNRLLDQWTNTDQTSTAEVLVQLRANACTTFQSSLKNIIKATITNVVGLDGYAAFLAKHKRLLPMNFDLELLQVFAGEQNLKRVIVSVVDVETFETVILSQLLSTFSSWTGRIPFVVLLGIATTVELFQSRLPKATLELLDAQTFYLSTPDDLLYQVFIATQLSDDHGIILGPTCLSALNDLAQSQSTTTESFVNTLKFAYMSHYFTNPLSALLASEKHDQQSLAVLCDTIRSTESFRRFCEDLVVQDKNSRSIVQRILSSNHELVDVATEAIKTGRKAFIDAITVFQGLKDLHQKLNLEAKSSFLIDVQIYNQSKDITDSEMFDNVLTNLERLSSSQLLHVLESLGSSTIDSLDLKTNIQALQKFVRTHASEDIYSKHDLNVNSKVIIKPSKKITNSASKKTNVQDQYTRLIDSLTANLTQSLKRHPFDFQSFMNEAFIINSRQPLLSAFTPRPRYVIERALSKPADYLGCECNSEGHHTNDLDENTLPNKDSSANHHIQPPTSILYNLLQEAGTIINVRDLFDAFWSRIKLSDPDQREDEDNEADSTNGNEEEDVQRQKQTRLAMSLFYRSLSELKMLGMVKSSTSTMTKKRALATSEGGATGFVGKGKKAYAEIDFIAKTSWAGL